MEFISFEEAIATCAEKTKESYRLGFKKFIAANEVSGEAAAFLLCREDPYKALRKFLQSCKGLAPKSVRLYLSGIKLWLEANDIHVNFKKIKYMMPRGLVLKECRAFTKEQVRKLVLLATPSKKLLVWFYAVTGARKCEALEIKIKDVVFDHNPPYVIINTEKNHMRRIVFLPSDFATELKEFVKNRNVNDYLFLSEVGKKINQKDIDKSFRTLLKRAGLLIKDASGRGYAYSLHSLRRYYETTLVNAGVSPLFVGLFLGHRLGVESHYFKPSIADMADEWRKAEKYLLLESSADIEEKLKEFERIKERMEIYENTLKTILEKMGIKTKDDVLKILENKKWRI